MYIVKNVINMGGQTSISGTAVTIYIVSGGVSMAGGAAVNLTAPSRGTWQGTLFFKHAATLRRWFGGTTSANERSLYFPSAQLSYTGTGGSSTVVTATTIVVPTL
ncbi:MAG TPA: hypothetical protein VKE70_32765 [Candidatus Solibacter sp.]|nr:hypothetical protein [Candidatus Solibacter sp.]